MKVIIVIEASCIGQLSEENLGRQLLIASRALPL